MEKEKDFLAIINVGYGGGSWGRNKDKAAAIVRCAQIVKSDWKHLFKIPKTVKGMVYDVSGYNDVRWDDFGFYTVIDGKAQKIELKGEEFEHTHGRKG